jgi:hypothetical protein
MTIRHIHSPTHPNNSDAFNTQFLISTVALLLANTEKQAVQHTRSKRAANAHSRDTTALHMQRTGMGITLVNDQLDAQFFFIILSF